MTDDTTTDDNRDETMHHCPERDCGIPLLPEVEVLAHLRWDHNRSQAEAEAMLDAQ